MSPKSMTFHINMFLFGIKRETEVKEEKEKQNKWFLFPADGLFHIHTVVAYVII